MFRLGYRVSGVTQMTSSIGPGLDWILAWKSISAGSEGDANERCRAALAPINDCLDVERMHKTNEIQKGSMHGCRGCI